MVVRYSFANSILGPSVIRTCAASGVVGLTWAESLPLKTAITNMTSALRMFTSHSRTDDQSDPDIPACSVSPYGIGGLGTG
jgi:hypothetical protein